MRRWFMPALVLAAACAGADTAHVDVRVAVVSEIFVTPADRSTNMDSPAVWFDTAGAAWLIATGKSTNRLHVFDAATGAPIRTVGRRGSAPGEFRRPNGIAVVGDFAVIVERDNARVQVLRLPGFEYVGSFGEDVLQKPYGLAVRDRGAMTFDIFVTDDYRGPLGGPPRDEKLGERVKRFTVEFGNTLAAAYGGAFGDTAGAGRLRVVESLALDAGQGILLIADEAARDVKVYHLDGSFTGRVLWGDLIRYEPEGIALYECGTDDGYWIVTDQHRRHNRFLVFDRRSFELVGVFTGTTVRNTDGITIVQRAIGGLTAGVLYAVHDDRAVGAFAWRDIAAALGLRDDCVMDHATATQHAPTATDPTSSE